MARRKPTSTKNVMYCLSEESDNTIYIPSKPAKTIAEAFETEADELDIGKGDSRVVQKYDLYEVRHIGQYELSVGVTHSYKRCGPHAAKKAKPTGAKRST